MTHDIDRTRLAAKAQWTIAAVLELEALAIAGATQHQRQLDALRAEFDRLNNLDILSLQLPDGRVPAGIEAGLRCWYHEAAQANTIASTLKWHLSEAKRELAERQSSSMTVGLDDIRTILEEETHPVVQHLLVIEDDKVQVIDSLHQLLAHIIAVDTNWPASEMESLRRQLAWTQDQLARSNHALTDNIRDAKENHDANEAMYAEEIATITGKVRALAEAIRPINTGAAEIAARCDFGAAIDVIAQAVTELAGQIMDGGRGETAKALAVALADADRIEDQIHAIEAVCEAGGMPPTIEREDIPAWLAEHLTTRIERKEKVKKAKKVKAPAIEADDDQGQLSILDEVSDA